MNGVALEKTFTARLSRPESRRPICPAASRRGAWHRAENVRGDARRNRAFTDVVHWMPLKKCGPLFTFYKNNVLSDEELVLFGP